MNKKNWIMKQINKELVDQLVVDYKIPRLTAIVFQNRFNIISNNIENIKINLIDKLYDPFLLKNMDIAVNRINNAIKSKEVITIYGDYDADGVTSTSVLYMFLKDKGAVVNYYIPDRVEEGYGINTSALDKIKQDGTNLIITVDTGVTAISEVAYAKSIGLDVIITDHHECKDEVPNCCCVIDPKQDGCSYPFKEIAGVGVVFKLITALSSSDELNFLIDKYMPLVCLGTIADVAPLIDENRVFVRLGLKNFSNSNNVGINALLKVAELSDKNITAGNIGFIIAPRINAAGRLGSAYKSVELFLSNDMQKCLSIANELSLENKTRQAMEKEIFEQAVDIIEKNRLQDNKVIVVAKEGWHHGVIGIVSSKITEKYYRPSILISVEDNIGKASGRSISSFNLFEALTNCSSYLDKFGGHSLAAGLSLNASNIKAFSDAINNYANSVLSPNDFIPTVYIDAVLSNDFVNIPTIEKLSILEPYGMGNPTPVLAYVGGKIKLLTTMSSGKHLRLLLAKDNGQLEVIGFNYGYLEEVLKIGDLIDVCGNVNINVYNDNKKVQLVIKDIRKHKKKLV